MLLCISNLHSQTTSADLHHLCSQFGTVLQADIVTDEVTGDSRGMAFVEMSNGANAALDILNRFIFQGRSLKVSEARPPEKRRRVEPKA